LAVGTLPSLERVRFDLKTVSLDQDLPAFGTESVLALMAGDISHIDIVQPFLKGDFPELFEG
jgi:hypothetical protein